MKLFKSGELSLLWPFYLDALFSPMLFFMPAFMVIYFQDLGFSIFQISILTMMVPLFMLFFEVPTGAIADLYGRKFSVLLGALLNGAVLVSIYFLSGFYSLLFAFAMIGFGNTFNSGAREAWVTDLLRTERKDFLHSYFAKVQCLASLGLLVSGIIGAFLVKQFGMSIIWTTAGISCFVSFFLLGMANEHFVKRKVKLEHSFKRVAKQSLTALNYAKNHHVIFSFLFATCFLVFSSVFNMNLSWIPFLKELNFPDYAFGYMWSAMGAVGIFAPLISLKLMKKGNERLFIFTITILSILFTSLILFVQSIAFAFVVLLSSMFFYNVSFPAERVYFHRFVKSRLRATVGSVENMLVGLISTISMPLAGLSVDYLGARYTILLSAILMIPAAIIFLKIKEKP